MTYPDISLETVLSQISKSWGASQTSPELRERFIAWSRENASHIDRLRAVVGSSLAWWIIKGVEAGHDHDVLEQVALQQTQNVIAHVAWTMKRRQGEPFDPGRIAIVAYIMADAFVTHPPKELDLDSITKVAEEIGADADCENERLRNLIDEIADMDVGDIEIEHREIIARCRAEQKIWLETDAPSASGPLAESDPEAPR